MADTRRSSASPTGDSSREDRVATPGNAPSSSPRSPASNNAAPVIDDQAHAPLGAGADDASSVDGYESASDRAPSLTTSLSSSIRDFNFENKRRYHKYKEGRYHFPNDDAEQEREDMKHHMIVALCNNELHNAPVEDPERVLDIGTGTGIWAIEMGEVYPEADIEGIDLSPIQPAFVPSNVRFIIDDAEAEWLYPDNSFDYIHLRHMAPSIKNWPLLLEQAYRALKPGGWLEIQDIDPEFHCDDGTMPPGQEYAPQKMVDLIKEGLATFGVSLRAAISHKERIEAAGYQNLIHDVKKVPAGPWPKDSHLASIGSYCRAVIYDGVHGNSIGPLTKGLGWSPMEVEIFLIQVRKAMMSDEFHSYITYHSYSGQKPL